MKTRQEIIKRINQRDVEGGNLRPHLLALKEQELGEIKCEDCGAKPKKIKFHHKRYGLDVNYKDLVLLCSKCHGIRHRRKVAK